MRSGDLARAWEISDAVLASRDPVQSDNTHLPYHERWIWTGTPPDGLDVLVRCYHGLGDTIQFVRFLPALRRRAARVTLEVQPELLPLIQGSEGFDRLVAFDVEAPLPPSDCTMEIMELAHVLRVTTADISGAGAYLRTRGEPPPWSQGRIGLCWRAGDWDPDRSLDLQSLLAGLDRTHGFVSLQRGVAAAEADPHHFVNPHDNDLSIDRTAGLILGCDHVVSVDTMVAHLTGAVGVRGTVLLKPEPDWRWAERDGRSLWYPTLRLADLRTVNDLMPRPI
jgi:hypothetical protein